MFQDLEQPEEIKNMVVPFDPEAECDGTDQYDSYESFIFDKGDDGFLTFHKFEEDTKPFGFGVATIYALKNIGNDFNVRNMNFSFGRRLMLKREISNDNVTSIYLKNTFEGIDLLEKVENFLNKFLETKLYKSQCTYTNFNKSNIKNKYLDFTEKKIVISWSTESYCDTFTIYELEKEIVFN